MNYEETYRNFDEEYRNFDEEYKKLYAAAQTGRTLRDYFAAKAMQGLEALEELYNTNSSWWQEVDEQTIKKIENSITAIKEALAQTQEPKIGCVNHDCDKCKAQRTWVGLTDEEENEYNYLGPDMHWVIQEISAKLKEKNT